MSQIRTSSLALATLLCLLILPLSGCGDANSPSSLDSSTGEHAAGWLATGHKAVARADVSGCTECHGDDLAGGISRVSCTQCHLGNAQSVHPGAWGNFAYAFHAGYVKNSPTGSSSCATAFCHGTDLLGSGDNPSCAVNCHMAGTAQAPQKHAWDSSDRNANIAGHISYFGTHPKDYTTCRNNACHGGAGTSAPPPGVFLSGPACSECHGSGNPLPAEE